MTNYIKIRFDEGSDATMHCDDKKMLLVRSHHTMRRTIFCDEIIGWILLLIQ